MTLYVEGAQVMLLKPLSRATGLVNGARGIVTGFTKNGRLPIVYFNEKASRVIINRQEFSVQAGRKMVACRSQIPLCLAWAVSIHKSQGLSLSRAKLDLSKVFEYGQAYVALSRLKSLDGMIITGQLRPGLVRAHPKVKEFYRTMKFST